MQTDPENHPRRIARTEGSFERARAMLILRMVLISALLVFGVETLLMVSLNSLLHLDRFWLFFLDGLILVLLLFPLNYFFVIRPMLRQIEEHRRTNLELLRSSEVLEHFFAIPDILIAYLDANFNFIRVNQTYADTNQRRPEDFVGKNHFDLFPDPRSQQLFQSVVDSGQAFRITENPYVYANHPERGVTYWDWTLFPIKDSAGRVVGLLSTAANVTERKLTQQALADSERRFRGVFNQTFQHSALLEPSGLVLVVNQTALDFTGVPPDQVTGQYLWDLAWWADGPQEVEHRKDTVRQAATGQTMRCEHRVRSSAGTLATMDITIKPLLNERGETVLLIYEGRDITTHIQTEDALRRSEEENLRLYQAEKRANQLSGALRSAVINMAASLNIDEVLGTVLDHLARLTPYTGAQILLYDAEERLVVRSVRCKSQKPEALNMRGQEFTPADLLFTRRKLQDGLAICLPDISAQAELPFFTCLDWPRSYLAIPLLNGNKLIGVCALEHTDPDHFTPELVQAGRMLADRAVAFIQNALLYEQVLESRERLQALSRRLVEVQENERRYVAQELHDDAGQALASLMVGLRVLEDIGVGGTSSGSEMAARIRELKQIADGVLENLHRLAVNLRPAALDQLGLEAALRQHVEQISRQHGLAIQFETVGLADRLPGEVETAVYRVVQEALTNVIKHAHASQVQILVNRRRDKLIVIVEDNGVGFSPYLLKEGQIGTIGMQERIEMLGGKFHIESTPGKGSAIFLEIPCPFES